MAQIYGWVGKILRVDLTKGEITDVCTSRYAPKFIGGRAIGAKIYWDEVPPEVAAFDPENKLIIMTGPATGTLAPCASRVSIIAKSPLPTPECFMYSHPGGHWGPELKFAGYDGVIVQGRAPKPVYLWINDEEVEIRNAYRLWGMNTRVAQTEIQRLHGEKARAMIIGPAGENMCREAVIAIGANAAAGLGGFGAVMASKNLKAIVARGTKAVRVARPKELMDLYFHFTRLVTRRPEESEPQHFWRSMQFYSQTRPIAVPFVDDSALGEEVAKGNATKRWGGCFACPVSCLQGYWFKDGLSGAGCCNDIMEIMEDEWRYYGGKPLGKDSFEFGVLCQELGLSTTQVMGHLEERYGLHGATWARLLIEAGIWTTEKTGLPVDKIGSSEFNREYLHKVAYRQGIGELLAEGQDRYLKTLVEQAETEGIVEKAKKIYEETTQKKEPSYTVHWQMPPYVGAKTGGWQWLLEISTGVRLNHLLCFVLEFPLNLIGLTAEKSKRLPQLLKEIGLKHFGSEKALDPLTPEGKVPLEMYLEHVAIESDSLPYCRIVFPSFYSPYAPDLLGDPTYGGQVFSAVTGIDRSEEEMLRLVGERSFNLERAILVREGRRRQHDLSWNDFYYQLFKSWMTREKLSTVMDEYYQARGWDVATGIPTRAKLDELELNDVADELARLDILP